MTEGNAEHYGAGVAETSAIVLCAWMGLAEIQALAAETSVR